MVHVILRTIKD